VPCGVIAGHRPGIGLHNLRVERKLFIVTGAPGAGKSATVAALLNAPTRYLVFDVDWLAEPASRLAGRSIYTERSTWPPYAHVWFAVILAAYRNACTPVLFGPFDKDDLAEYGLPEWCTAVEWLLLDCADDVRETRLSARQWSPARLADAMADAQKLRNTIADRVDTGMQNPVQTARHVVRWLDRHPQDQDLG